MSAELDEQGSASERHRKRVDAQLTERTEGSLRALRKGLTARETRVPRSRPVPVGPAGPVRTRVDTQTPYLTLAELDERRYRALDGREHPLVARNANVFTVPYGDAADAVVGGAFEGGDRVARTAAHALAAADRTLEAGSNATLASERDALQREVAAANTEMTTTLWLAVSQHTEANRSRARRLSLKRCRRGKHATRALALTNGPFGRVARVAVRRTTRVERDRVRLQLLSVDTPATRPTLESTNGTASAVRSVANDEVSSVGVARRTDGQQLAKKRLGTDRLPAGLPLAPPVTPWYATATSGG
ncbi:hypothetical protein C8039_09830 [Halogeometricum sp. wsp3]|nr:hypothetical protein C8039_09830 [Halogeometricum sp. wsp3]